MTENGEAAGGGVLVGAMLVPPGIVIGLGLGIEVGGAGVVGCDGPVGVVTGVVTGVVVGGGGIGPPGGG
jgi:hypothetical protein